MATGIDSDLLRTFVAIADSGNFTRAGDIVGRTQSAVSLQVKRLEDIVGGTLFERNARGVALTTPGSVLLPKARRIVALLEEAEAAMRVQPLNGIVRIGVPEEHGHTVLPEALGAFGKLHPDVEITVHVGHSAQHRVSLAGGLIDLAVVFEPADSSSAEWLATDPTVWVTSSLHGTHERQPIPIALCGWEDWCRRASLKSLDQVTRPFRVAYTANTSGGLQTAAASGLAIAPLSRSHIPPGCRELTMEDGFPIIDASNVGLLYDRKANDAVEGMANAVRAAFAPKSVS